MTPPGKRRKLSAKWKEREKLREKGQFWTPDWVARPMVRYVLGSRSKLLFDPAVGSGAFLEALRSLDIEGPETGFYGVDIDSSVLNRAIYKITGCRIEVRDFIHNPPGEKFDSIVANPPYIRHHRLSAGTKERLRAIAVRYIGYPLDGRAGLHIYFLIQALALLAPGGRLAFIMPADTCEGLFARKLWEWILSRYCLDAAISFVPEATPFPGVDTNAMVFMIRNTRAPKQTLWIRCKEAGSSDLLHLVGADFRNRAASGLEVTRRDLKEAIRTGLSRSPATGSPPQFMLSDFACIMRGVATGANEFFWMTGRQVSEFGIPGEFLRLAVGRTRVVPFFFQAEDGIRDLDARGRPTLLFSPDARPMERFPKKVRAYLERGVSMGLPGRALIGTRNPWYKMETREVPPFLFAYLGRRNARFIRNEAGAIPLTGFLCVYPHRYFRGKTAALWALLNAKETVAKLHLVGKSYGPGAIKGVPRNLERLPIPDALIDKLGFPPRKADRRGNPRLFEPRRGYAE